MNANDKTAFGKLITDAMAFYGKDVSTFALSVWWAACERFDMEQVSKAVTAHAMDPEGGQFPPKPADIMRKLQGTQTDRTLLAWGKVIDAMQRVGAYTSVVFDDGAIHAAISDMGGWPAVCRTGADELPFVQRRFCDLHRAYSARGDQIYPARLLGEHEATNRLNGRAVAAPALIGDATKALQIERNGSAGSKTAISIGAALPQLTATPDRARA